LLKKSIFFWDIGPSCFFHSSSFCGGMALL